MLLATMTLVPLAPGLAQDATPSANGAGANVKSFTSYLRPGSCTSIERSLPFRLADVDLPQPLATEDLSNTASPVGTATSEVDLSLDALVAGNYALPLQEVGNPSQYVACGNVRGTVDASGNLFIALDEVRGSGYAGVAWFHAEGDVTVVTVMLTQSAPQPTAESQHEGLVTATSLWVVPLDPNSTLVPSFDLPIASQLNFMIMSQGITPTRQYLETSVQDVTDNYESQGIPVTHADVPLYGIATSGVSGGNNDGVVSALFIIDANFVYVLESLSVYPDDMSMDRLVGIADAMFDPERSNTATEVLATIAAKDPSAAMLGRLPRREDVPDQYQFVGEEVFFEP
jgi:hypothetical protein